MATTLSHAAPEFFAALQEGDMVIGILPVALAAKVCATGATYYDLALPNLPPEWRGQAGAELNLYQIQKKEVKTNAE